MFVDMLYGERITLVPVPAVGPVLSAFLAGNSAPERELRRHERESQLAAEDQPG
jgi:hypothetical protein